MIIAIVGISLLFIVIGFVVTQKNAKYLLAGYNTMSEEDRRKIDLKAYLRLFRRFHLYLGLSLMFIGVIISIIISEQVAGVFLGVYPVIAYLYFLWITTKNA